MSQSTEISPQQRTALLIVSWAWVLIPFAYGLDQLIVKVAKLFNS